MTTNIRIVSEPDLSIDNQVMNLSSVPLLENMELAGVGWFVVGRTAYEALVLVLRFVYGLISKELPDYRVWLLVGNSAWQPDTRVVRYRKLWGALAARDIKVSHSCNAQEVLHEREGKLKFFGATQLSELSVGSVAKVVLEERCTYLAVLPGSIELKDILDVGWSGELTEDFQFLVRLVGGGGFLIQRNGEFDDQEKGVVAIGRPEIVNLLLS